MHKFDKFDNPTLPDIAAAELDFYAKVFRETCSSDGLMGGKKSVAPYSPSRPDNTFAVGAIAVEILGQSDLSRGQLGRIW